MLNKTTISLLMKWIICTIVTGRFWSTIVSFKSDYKNLIITNNLFNLAQLKYELSKKLNFITCLHFKWKWKSSRVTKNHEPFLTLYRADVFLMKVESEKKFSFFACDLGIKNKGRKDKKILKECFLVLSFFLSFIFFISSTVFHHISIANPLFVYFILPFICIWLYFTIIYNFLQKTFLFWFIPVIL